MENTSFHELLLKTSFAIIACDGDIDPAEVQLIIELDKEENLYGVQDIEKKLDRYIAQINDKGHDFMHEFFEELDNSHLSFEEEKELVGTAIKMIEADNYVHYSEIKFFKIIHNHLNITSEQILQNFSHVNDIDDYVAQDAISNNLMDKLKSDYFDNHELPQFESIKPSNDE